MEAVALQSQINLFADNLPCLEDIKKISYFVHSGESNFLAFGHQLEQNLSQTGSKAALANGIGLYIIGRYKEAVEKLEKGKDCAEKFFYLASAHRRIGQYEQAVKDLDKSLDFQTDPLIVSIEKIKTYRSASNYEAAEKELKKITNFQNVSAEYHYQLARLQEDCGRYDQAIENYKIALDLAPDHHKALFHLAYRCDIFGDEDEAIDYYKQITASSPAYVSALINLAILYEDTGKFDKASDCIERILRYYPNHQRAILFKKDIDSSKTMVYDEEKEKKKTIRSQLLETPISDFELSVRSRNCLKKMNIRTIGDLLRTTEAELLAYKNFGETSLREIKSVLNSRNLRLGMAIEEQQQQTPEIASQITPENQSILSKSISDMQLSVRARNCLQKLNIQTIGDLVRKTEAELLGVKNFGVTSLNEIKRILSGFGLSLRSID